MNKNRLNIKDIKIDRLEVFHILDIHYVLVNRLLMENLILCGPFYDYCGELIKNE
jgi:hypothetical protein